MTFHPTDAQIIADILKREGIAFTDDPVDAALLGSMQPRAHLSQRAVRLTPLLQRLVKGLVVNPIFVGCLPSCHGLAVDANHPVCTHVVHLRLWQCPSTIARFVIAIYIDSVKRMRRRWSWADVINKGREVSHPFIAHANATASVTRILRIIRLATPTFGVKPRSVFRSPASSACRSMGCASECDEFTKQASATHYPTASQWVSADVLTGAAVTQTSPHSPSILVRRASDNYETTESLAFQFKALQVRAHFLALQHVLYGGFSYGLASLSRHGQLYHSVRVH